jgi:hypothetical protein
MLPNSVRESNENHWAESTDNDTTFADGLDAFMLVANANWSSNKLSYLDNGS